MCNSLFWLCLHITSVFLWCVWSSLTPGELILRCHRPLHQFGSDQACAQTVCIFCVVLTTHAHARVNTHLLSDVTHVIKHKVCVGGQQMFLSEHEKQETELLWEDREIPKRHDGIDLCPVKCVLWETWRLCSDDDLMIKRQKNPWEWSEDIVKIYRTNTNKHLTIFYTHTRHVHTLKHTHTHTEVCSCLQRSVWHWFTSSLLWHAVRTEWENKDKHERMWGILLRARTHLHQLHEVVEVFLLIDGEFSAVIDDAVMFHLPLTAHTQRVVAGVIRALTHQKQTRLGRIQQPLRLISCDLTVKPSETHGELAYILWTLQKCEGRERKTTFMFTWILSPSQTESMFTVHKWRRSASCGEHAVTRDFNMTCVSDLRSVDANTSLCMSKWNHSYFIFNIFDWVLLTHIVIVFTVAVLRFMLWLKQ